MNPVQSNSNTNGGQPNGSQTNGSQMNISSQLGGKPTIFTPLYNGISYINHHIMYLNNSKFFAGVVMILLNIGSKFITIQFSKSTEEYMKYTVTKQLLVFAMAWMGTRDIYTALGLTAVFTILSDYLFNEESALCMVPYKYRVLHKLVDTNEDGVVSDPELSDPDPKSDPLPQEKIVPEFKSSLYGTGLGSDQVLT